MLDKNFLGTGWAFPVAFDKSAGTVQMVSFEEDVNQSIDIILGTTPGERIMQPEFGCNLKQLVFEEVNSSLVAKIDHLIYHAILNFEPRIKLIKVDVDIADELNGILKITITYTYIATNTRHNYVYPLYLKEGTNL